MAPCGMAGDRHRDDFTRPTGNLVVLFIYFGSSQLLLTLSDGFTLNLGFVQIPVQMQIENFDVSPFLCGAIALSCSMPPMPRRPCAAP